VVVVVDFLAHDAEWMREELGVHWLGFPAETLAAWFADAGLAGFALERHAGTPGARNLPASFIASARRPR
jgi:hypothetical protein